MEGIILILYLTLMFYQMNLENFTLIIKN